MILKNKFFIWISEIFQFVLFSLHTLGLRDSTILGWQSKILEIQARPEQFCLDLILMDFGGKPN
jgi:hypothetical protein